jgi:hypothetical protein
MLLVVIAALVVALVVQQDLAARRETELRARLKSYPKPTPVTKIMRLPYRGERILAK